MFADTTNPLHLISGWTENIAILRNIKKAPKPLKSVNDIKDGELGINYDATNSDPYHLYPFQTMFSAPVFKTVASGPNKGDWSDTVGMGVVKVEHLGTLF